ncbi:MAG: hypothetical protein HS116_04390 [Planctomycetes bacterium]|nr:hypothetical protein [Planctomycetota bacterium]
MTRAKPDLPPPFPPLPPEQPASGATKPATVRGTADYYEQFKPENAPSAFEPAAETPVPAPSSPDEEALEEQALPLKETLKPLLTVLGIRIGARVAAYLAAVWIWSHHPAVSFAIYVLVTADFFYHFIHSVLFRELREGVQAWVSVAVLLGLGWLDPNGYLGLKGYPPSWHLIFSTLVFMIVLIRLSSPAIIPQNDRYSVWLGAEPGPGYGPRSWTARAVHWSRQVWDAL